MNSLARWMFLLNFQTPSPRFGTAEWMPAGPAGLVWWLMSSAIGIFSFRAALYGLIGLWIHEPLPERMNRLLEASSQDRTSGSIASRKSSFHHSMTCAVLSELMAGVLPSASMTFAPYDPSTDPAVGFASPQWLMATPPRVPRFFSVLPWLSSSPPVFGVSSPALLK